MHYNFLTVVKNIYMNISKINNSVGLDYRKHLHEVHIDDAVFPVEFSENFEKCIHAFIFKAFNTPSSEFSNPPYTCEKVENIIKKLSIDLVLKFQTITLKLPIAKRNHNPSSFYGSSINGKIHRRYIQLYFWKITETQDELQLMNEEY